ncbi:Ig-like domain-containing protein [Lysinibacter sp. HNR]|uniref:Ig-like domain-containing protein n=1 Tax=Lysinibacter sp. HNR TaxID=3031408 RepID=UPI002434AFA6|nr:Ig-like domain-containing protein [Lysinibacter sp. HNR]WGD37986.1 Ig-like domain-containing protein [Lysinibacter sp. HNR]
MIVFWIKKHLGAVISGLAAVLVLVLVVTIAIASSGYTTQRVDLGDASTWVVNDGEQAVGRLNTQISALDTAQRSERQNLTVVQGDELVLLHAVSQRELSIVDESLASVEEGIQLPSDASEVLLAGDTTVIHSAPSGRVWFVPNRALSNFNAESDADLVLGSNSAVAVDSTGRFVGFSASSEMLERDVRGGGNASQSTQLSLGGEEDSYAAAVVSGRPVVLNLSTGSLSIDGRAGIQVDIAENPVLMSSSTASSEVYISDSRGLLRVGLNGGGEERVFTTPGNVAQPSAAPAVVGECVLAAWPTGVAWRSCGGSEGESLNLADMDADARLTVAVRASYAVLNDEVSGRSWMIQDSGQLVDNWDKILEELEEDQKQQENDPSIPPEIDPVQQPPVANDDVFGARPGRATPLPVLLNDYDPNGDVIVITETANFPENMGSISIIENGQKLQVTLASDAAGTFEFQYTITDGHGGQDSATVTVEVRGPQEKNAPVQARPTGDIVAAGGQFERDVLADWYHPDGDPLFLADAVAADPDVVTYSAQGTVYYKDSGSGGSQKTVGLAVSDGTLTTHGNLSVEVVAGAVPIVAETVAAVGNVGQEAIAYPLESVRGGNGEVRLTGIPEDNLARAQLRVNTDTGEVGLTADQPGSYNLEYRVSDGTSSAAGKLRFEITGPPNNDLPPVTVPSSVFLYLNQTETVDVLASNYDPAGGVLLLSEAHNPLENQGLIVEILNHGVLRVSLTEPLENGSVEFSYSVTNGHLSSRGTVTVLQVDPPAKEKPPVATPDQARVRVGEVVDIPVLENDLHPDNLPLTLSPDLASSLPESEGLLFASGSILRYLAPDTPGEYTASYVVESPGGEIASAPVNISVREADAENNSAPTPRTVTSRVVQGGTVRIPIPLTGIDADGDTVVLSGVESAPRQGIVTSTGKDYIEYEAGARSLGTDTFYYSVTDSLGAVGTGQIRVGIMETSGVAANPIARTDVVAARPDSTLIVKPLENDSDPDGGQLRIVAVEEKQELPAAFDDETVTLTTPSQEGVYSVLYTVQNESGGQSSAWIQVAVQRDAPPARPVVDDTVLTLTDITDGGEKISVDVWENVFYAEGTERDLDLSLVPGWESGAEVKNTRNLEVTVAEHNQIIPFRISVADSPEIASHGFIWVPGTAMAVPERRTNAPELTVASGERLSININEQIIAAENKRVRITDPSTVKATNGNGANLAQNETSIDFVSAPDYWGPASVTLEVTDAPAGSNEGKRATIVLPITVTPTSNQPPTIRGAAFTLEPALERTVDLSNLTSYPHPEDEDRLVWSQPQPVSNGATASIRGDQLTVRVNNDTPVGTIISVPIGVRDDTSEVATANVQVTVVSSTKPKIQALPDTVELTRGSSRTVDVLANDVGPEELRPFTVVGVEVVGTARGVTATPSADRRTITISATADADITTNLQLNYRVQDSTGQPDRVVTGTVTAIVIDAPDAPGAPNLTSSSSFQNDGRLRFSFTAPNSNGKPIENYILRSTDGSVEVNCGRDSSSCVVTDGQARAGVSYQFTAIAVNSVGRSEPSAPGTSVMIDYVPEAPTGISATVPEANSEFAPTNQGLLNVQWSPGAANRGNPASSFRVTVLDRTGGTVWERVVPASGSGAHGVTTDRLPYGQYSIRVESRNNIDSAKYGAVSWRSSTQSGFETRQAPSAPEIVTSVSTDTVTANWSVAAPGGSAIRSAVAWSPVDGAPATPSCAAARNGGTQTRSDQRVTANGVYTVSVVVWNGWACSTHSASVQYVSVPGKAGVPGVNIVREGDQGIPQISLPSVPGAQSFVYQVNNNPYQLVPPDGRITGYDPHRANTVRVQACGAAGGGYCGPPSDASASFAPYNLAIRWESNPALCRVGSGTVTPALHAAGTNLQYGYATSIGGPWVGDWVWGTPVPSNAAQILARATFTFGGATVETLTPLRTEACAPVTRIMLRPGAAIISQ